MSKKIDNLYRLIQDLESRYGKDDVDVQQLYAELGVLKSLREADHKKRRTFSPLASKPYTSEKRRNSLHS